MTRNRAEAAWTHPEAKVKGKVRRNKAWVLIGMVAVLTVVIVLAWARLMNFQDVTYEVRECTQPLDRDSTWEQVEAANCQTLPTEGKRLTLWAGGDQQDADTVDDTTWTFESVPLNTVLTAMEIRLTDSASTVVLAEPENEVIRRALSGDASGTRWSANVGSRGPSTYWVLVTP
ncbi:hypothetical protein ACQBAT_13360 [Ornithinimicrobium sp. Y1847]|uniref:hypothetical protein n=1 Tax=Ornithinimicrobium sp. Y1847 TaxID=3405419 RepID=UPI003B676CDA